MLIDTKFFDYFERTWLKGRVAFEAWKVSGFGENDDIRLISTNNALENFNRQLNNAVGTPHPSAFTFVEVIREISTLKLHEIKDVHERGGRRPDGE